MSTKRFWGLPTGYWWALVACAATTLIATPLRAYLDAANLVMLFLLTVLLIAAYFGRGPAVLAAFLSVALFDFFFVPPRFTFTVDESQYLVTFAVMLAVALVTGQLTAGLRQQAEVATRKEQRTHALYEIARGLAGALTIKQAYDIVRQVSLSSFQFDAVLLLPNEEGHLRPLSTLEHPPWIEPHLASMAFAGEPVMDYLVSGYGYGYGAAYFPLKAAMKTLGVIVFAPTIEDVAGLREQKSLLATIASVAATVVERLHYVEVAQKAKDQSDGPH